MLDKRLQLESDSRFAMWLQRPDNDIRSSSDIGNTVLRRRVSEVRLPKGRLPELLRLLAV